LQLTEPEQQKFDTQDFPYMTSKQRLSMMNLVLAWSGLLLLFLKDMASGEGVGNIRRTELSAKGENTFRMESSSGDGIARGQQLDLSTTRPLDSLGLTNSDFDRSLPGWKARLGMRKTPFPFGGVVKKPRNPTSTEATP